MLKTIETKGGAFEWDLHFWLGAESSVDEVFHVLRVSVNRVGDCTLVTHDTVWS